MGEKGLVRNKIRLPVLILIWLGWTAIHTHLIGLVEDLGSKSVLIFFYIMVVIGTVVIGRMELEGKKNL